MCWGKLCLTSSDWQALFYLLVHLHYHMRPHTPLQWKVKMPLSLLPPDICTSCLSWAHYPLQSRFPPIYLQPVSSPLAWLTNSRLPFISDFRCELSLKPFYYLVAHTEFIAFTILLQLLSWKYYSTALWAPRISSHVCIVYAALWALSSVALNK